MASPTNQVIDPVLIASCDGVQASIKQDGQALLTPGVGVSASQAASGLTVSGWDRINQESRVLNVDANGDLIVVGTIIVIPGFANDDQDTTNPFTNVAPAAQTVTPAGDYQTEYFTAHLLGLTVGSAVTLTMTYLFAAGATFSTVVVTKTVAVPASGIVDFYIHMCDFRKGGDGIQIDVTTTSVAGTGRAYMNLSYDA